MVWVFASQDYDFIFIDLCHRRLIPHAELTLLKVKDLPSRLGIWLADLQFFDRTEVLAFLAATENVKRYFALIMTLTFEAADGVTQSSLVQLRKLCPRIVDEIVSLDSLGRN